jgi:hypothetical protein
MRSKIVGGVGLKIEWASVSEACEFVRHRASSGSDKPFWVGRGGWGSDWLGREGISGWGDIWKMAAGVWPDGMERVRKIRDAVGRAAIPAPRSTFRRGKWDVVGDHYDLERARVGAEPWRTTTRVKLPANQHITLMVQLHAPAMATPEQLFGAPATALAITEILERAGYTVEIVGYVYTCQMYAGTGITAAGRLSDRLYMTVPVKAHGKPPALSAMVNVVSPWFFRTATFGMFHAAEEHGVTLSGGYGGALYLHNMETEMSAVRADYPGRDVYTLGNVWDADAAVSVARRVIDEVGRRSAA